MKAKCFICNNENLIIRNRYLNSTLFNKKLYSCSSCEFSFLFPLSQEYLEDFYSTEYVKDFNRTLINKDPKEYFKNENNQFRRNRSLRHVNTVKKYKNIKDKLNILDIGAGLGTTLYYSKKLFKDSKLYAYENDISMFKYLEEIDTNITTGSLKNLDNKYFNFFDIIYCSHFIEHISNEELINFVQILNRILKKNGILLLETPNDNYFKYPLLLNKKPHPHHTIFFSKKSLNKLFKNQKI
ncbi:class I SAM-dependent methyltransferase, partial [Alphaproteobacteria bacterium]|nr:class I SAM-dependent methyltransferase [Alphaproteobacteria bacterium]